MRRIALAAFASLIALAGLTAAAPARAQPLPTLVVAHLAQTTETAGCIQAVQTGLSTIPASLQAVVVHAGVQVVVTPFMTFDQPELRSVKIFGQPASGDRYGGLFEAERNRILVPEQVLSDRGMVPTGSRVVGTVRHEFGHALDRAMGGPSRQPPFLAAYDQDYQVMSEADRQAHKYFVGGPAHNGPNVPSVSGRGEAFAEMVHVLCTPDGERNAANRTFLRLFPHLRAYMTALVPELSPATP